MQNNYQSLFSPVKIGGVTLKNRVIMTAMGGTAPFGYDGKYNPKIREYYMERVKGGVGLIVPGVTGVKSAVMLDGRQEHSILVELLTDSGSITAGLKRLAFGSCTDAVYLVFADELPPPAVIEGLDLFNVSEIKRVKGGGVEIKLFDRLKALEKLSELENSFNDRSKAADLIMALTAHTEESDGIEDK